MNKIARCAALVLLGGLSFACSSSGGGGGNTPTQPSGPVDENTVLIEIFDNEFRPKSVRIQAGQTVRWVLRGNGPAHTTTARDGIWDSGFAFPTQGAMFERQFPASEDGQTFEYACLSHEACCNMRGSIQVGATAPPADPGYS